LQLFNSTNAAYYLADTMVTPQISGLFNENAIGKETDLLAETNSI
jgi:hypothetical protein